jgi:O-antigen ligase
MFSEKIEKLYLSGIKVLIFLLPFLSLYVSPSMDYPFITGKNFAFRIVIEILVVLWVGLCCINKSYRLRTSKLTILVLFFTFIVGLADLFGVNPYNSFWSNYERMEGYITILHLMVYFLIMSSFLNSERDWKILFNMFVISGIFVSLCAFIFPPASDVSKEFSIEYASRIYSTIGNPPFLASYILMIVFIVLFLFFTSQRKLLKCLYVMTVLMYLIIIYFSASRGAILSLAIGISIFVFFVFINQTSILKINKYKKIIAYSVVITVITAAFFLTLLTSNKFLKQDKTLSRFTSIKTDKSVATRLNTWEMAWNGFKERPILGWGQENFYGIYMVNRVPALEGIVLLDRAHNIILDWMINAGLLGIFAYLTILGYSFLIVWKAYFKKKVIKNTVFTTLFTALTVYFIQNLFTFDTINTYLIYFALLSFIDSINKKDNDGEYDQNNKVEKNKKLKPTVFAFLALLIFSFFVYYVNYKPIKASRLSVRISESFPKYKSLSKLGDDFKKALSYETFGSTNIRLKMLGASLQIIRYELFEVEGALDFIKMTIEELKKGMLDNYHNIDYLSNTIPFYFRLARIEPLFIAETEELIKQCIRINPYYEEFYFMLAEVYFLKKDYERAFEIIDKTVAKDTQNERKQLKLAEAAILASREGIAEQALEKVKKIRISQHAETSAGRKPVFYVHELHRFAKVYREINNFGKALKFYKEIIAASPTDAKYHFEIAEVYKKLGDNINAKKEANKAAELDPLKYNGKTKSIIEYYNKPLTP